MSNLSGKEIVSFNNSREILRDYFDSLKNCVPMSREEEVELLTKYINGGKTDKSIRDKLFLANMRFVVTLAKNYASYGFPLIDLIQEGNIGMIEAIDRYDFSKANNGSLVNFASDRILLHIRRYAKKNLKLTDFGRTNDREKLFFALPKYINSDVVHMNDELANKIANELNVRVCDVHYMYAYLRPYSHTSSIVTNEEGEEVSIYDTIPSDDLNVDDLYTVYAQNKEYATLIRNAMSILDERHQYVIKRRHLIRDGDSTPTLITVGAELGVSREAVRKMELRAIKQIKTYIHRNNSNGESLFK